MTKPLPRFPAYWCASALAIFFLSLHAWVMPAQYDEAAMILNAQEGDLFSAFTAYEGGTNNHVLLAFVTAVLLKAGAQSVFVFRIPALLSCIAVFAAIGRMTLNLRPALRFLLPLFVAAVPLFFDNLVMNRGYPLGLAFTLWGLLSVDRSITSVSVLWALAVATVPTFALDVAALAVGIAWSEGDWRKPLRVLVLTAGLSAIPYVMIFDEVVTTLMSLSGESKLSATLDFLSSLSLHSPYLGGLLFASCVAAAWVLKDRGDRSYWRMHLPLAALLPFGYARTHLLLGTLLIVTIFSALPSGFRWNALLAGFCVTSLLSMPWDKIGTQPATWPASGMVVARAFSPCVSVETKGLFIVLHDYYEKVEGTGYKPNPNCPDFIVTSGNKLGLPSYLRLHDEYLSPYGIEMYERSDLNRYGWHLLQGRRL